MKNYVFLFSDKIKSSKNYPRIIENKKCNINMTTILTESIDSTMDNSFFNISNTSILKKPSQLLDITDGKRSMDFSTSFNNNSTEIINEIPTENKDVSTLVCEDRGLNSTLPTFYHLNDLTSFTVKKDDELYCNNPQVTNASQNTGVYFCMYVNTILYNIHICMHT